MANILGNRVVAVTVGAAVVMGMGAGGAIGAAMVTSGDIKDQTIQSRDIHRNAVGSSELGSGSVGSPHLSDNLREKVNSGADDSAGYSAPEWSIIDRNVMGAGDAYLRSGPSSEAFGQSVQPPSGVGSLGLRVADGAKTTFGNQVDFVGDNVLELSELGFWVFTTNENNQVGTSDNMPNLTFEIDPNLENSTSNYSSMVFSPNETPPGWTQIDATSDDQGEWGLTGAAGTASGCDNNTTRCTWSELQAALNDGGEEPTIHTVAFGKGRDMAFSGAVDALNVNGEVYDFEPLGVK